MSKVSRNAPCPCGSGRKLKKCCGAPGAIPYTQADRAAGWDLLERLMVEHADEAELVFAEVWGRYIEREDELPEEFLAMSEEVEAAWFAIDYELDRGARLIDEALGSAPVGRSTRSFLETLSESSMRLYEVLETVVGSSVSLRDLVEGTEVTVHERTASRSLVRHECIAARVVQRGSSGQPELERGVLRIPEFARQGLIEEVRAMRAEFFEARPAAAAVDFYRTLPPLYHELWLSSFLDPPLPELVDASTGRGLRRREEGSWDWVDVNAAGPGQPACDPSWMSAELGLARAPGVQRPPPLAHERVAELVPGSSEASRAAAERIRARAGFSAGSMSVDDGELRRDLELQRFLRSSPASAGDGEPALAAPFLPLMVNFELHRRKIFWVDAGLSFQLENTELDVSGRELRAPFPSFVLVFTDRYALSLGERLLWRRPGDPLRGQSLRVATVYVRQGDADSGRQLVITVALDALGADLPSLLCFEVPADDGRSLQTVLASLGPEPQLFGAEVRDVNAARDLLHLTLNAIVYATSAGVTPVVRALAPRPRRAALEPHESDAVYFLPGTIDIRHVRLLQELVRAPGGREHFARFMVRGHWRRPAQNWEDQRLRWIEPYWRGPDLAAVIEKAYRLRPRSAEATTPSST